MSFSSWGSDSGPTEAEKEPLFPATTDTLDNTSPLAIADHLRTHCDRLRDLLQNTIQSELEYLLNFRKYQTCSFSVSKLDQSNEEINADYHYRSPQPPPPFPHPMSRPQRRVRRDSVSDSESCDSSYSISASSKTSHTTVQLCWENTFSAHKWRAVPNQPLCCLLSDGQVSTLASIVEEERNYNGNDCITIRSNSFSNTDFILQAMTDQLPSSDFKFLRLETPAWEMIGLLNFLERRKTIPLSEELVSLQGNIPARDIPVEMKAFIETLQQENESWIPAFNRRVSLFIESIGKQSTDHDISPLCEAIIKAFHNYTTQTILYVGPSEKLQGARSHLKKSNISKKDIAILSPQTRHDPRGIWMRNPCGNRDPYLVARHEIDGLRLLSQKLNAEISLEIENSKNPLHNSLRVMQYLEDSADDFRFFHAFSQANAEKEHQRGPNDLTIPEETHPMYNNWVSGKRLEDLGVDVSPEYLDIWEQEPEVRYEKLAAWESGIRNIQTQKLASLMKEYDLCQLNLDHHNTKNGLEISKIWAKRLILCDSENIASCLPELSCIMADTIVVQGADEIDEACILALLSPAAKRLVLIKNEHSWKSDSVEEGESLALGLSPNSLWNRLEAGGFLVTHLTAEKQSQEAIGLLQGTFKVPIPPFNLQERLERSEAWKSLQKMVGLDNVKDRVRLLLQRERFNAQRKSKGQFTVVNSFNGVIMGPPGTGKTTVARLYGQIMTDLNLLSSGNLIETSGTSLMGNSIDQTEENIREAIHSALGNVLIIEDAYSLWGGKRNSDSFHKAAVDTLVRCVSGFGPSNQCVLLVGCEDQLEEMFRHANPGLSREFPLESAFRLAEYSLVELGGILDLQLEEGQISCSTEAKAVAMDMIRRAMLSPRFVNARYIQQLVKNAISSCKRRCLSDPQLNSTILVPEDFSKVWNRALDAEAECKKAFEGFVGCDSIITQLLNDARVAKMSRARGLSMGDFIPFNYIFRGAPGTGKTTIARRMGEILFHMGLLATSEVIECSFSDLIGQDMDHKGPKVIELFDRALGKVLFIDDAFQYQGTGYYSRDPVLGDVINALQSPRFKEKVFIILAGYERAIDQFLSNHLALRIPFNRIMTFDSLTGEQSAQLLVQVLNKKGVLDVSEIGMPTYETHWELCEIFTSLSQKVGWANARDVHTLCDDIVRMVSLDLQTPDQPLKVTIEVVYEALRKMRGLRDGDPPIGTSMPFRSDVGY